MTKAIARTRAASWIRYETHGDDWTEIEKDQLIAVLAKEIYKIMHKRAERKEGGDVS